jgi:hypothetical protein
MSLVPEVRDICFTAAFALIVYFAFSFARTRSLSTKDVFQILLRSFHSAHCLILEQVEYNVKKPFSIEKGGAVLYKDLSQSSDWG